MKKLIYSLFLLFISNSLFSQAVEIDPSNRHKIKSDSASLSIGPTTYNTQNSGMLLFNENVNNPFLCGFGLINNGIQNKLFFTGGCLASFGSLGADTLMTLDRDNGRIGIMTSEPTSALTVDGDVELTGEVKATKKVTRCISIPGFAFHDLNENYELIQGLAVNSYVYYEGGTYPNLGYSYATVQLPQNAELLNLTGYVYDNSATDFARIEMERISNTTGTSNSIFFKETSGPYAADAFTAILDSTPRPIDNIVDNENYSYVISFTGVQDRSTIRLRATKLCYRHNDLYN
ncbi:hypothetical protein [Jiulongibacter sediminis]|uniref:Uncharacterized protein n=1 Tax=Jiulongibacter sediminis TaxID=1605367 RepID=A0A0P7C583_9BACT|nr:hypothetical protein [Jiulongibacter sediminis]KPM49493.1 hypothetical protein AFM12_02495 [Jiulongibacter sediminis]TBX26538.1 hypothetical protein TK44_02500 [Jiulongibacter sediminis]